MFEKKKVKLFVLFYTLSLFWGCQLSLTAKEPASTDFLTIEEVIYGLVGEPYRDGSETWDKPWGAHEGTPSGVPLDYDWQQGARPGEAWLDSDIFQAINIWGQAYEIEGGSPEKNYRIQIRNMISYQFKDGKWCMIEQTLDSVAGGWYLENFDENTSFGEKRFEPKANGGGISATMISGHTFHWWTNTFPRARMSDNAEAVFATTQVRLIPDADPDVDLSNVQLLVGLGLDGYTTDTYRAEENERITSRVIGRMQFITNEWSNVSLYICDDYEINTMDEYVNNITSRPLPPGVR